MESLAITDAITIPAEDLSFRAVRASGPGGQNVNKVASKVELRFDLAHTKALPAGVIARLMGAHGSKIDAEGRMVITSQRHRDQPKNLDDARDKLREWILAVWHAPRPRKATRPTRGSKERRLDAKKRHGETKRNRARGGDE